MDGFYYAQIILAVAVLIAKALLLIEVIKFNRLINRDSYENTNLFPKPKLSEEKERELERIIDEYLQEG